VAARTIHGVRTREAEGEAAREGFRLGTAIRTYQGGDSPNLALRTVVRPGRRPPEPRATGARAVDNRRTATP